MLVARREIEPCLSLRRSCTTTPPTGYVERFRKPMDCLAGAVDFEVLAPRAPPARIGASSTATNAVTISPGRPHHFWLSR